MKRMQTAAAVVTLLAAAAFAGPITWFDQADFPSPCEGMAGTGDGCQYFYVVGGYSPTTGYSKELWRYDVPGNRWDRLDDMPNAVSGAAVCYVDERDTGVVYVFGGRDASGAKSYFYKYNALSQKWTAGATPPFTDYGMACTRFEWGNVVFVLGGVNNPGRFWFYDHATGGGLWYDKASCVGASEGTALCSYGECYLFAAGGKDWGTMFKRYNVPTNNWDDMAPLPEGRWGSGLSAIHLSEEECRIYSFGGGSGADLAVRSCYSYNPEAWAWSREGDMSYGHISGAFGTTPSPTDGHGLGRLFAVGGSGEAPVPTEPHAHTEASSEPDPTPAVTVTHPNGGEKVAAGQAHTVTWWSYGEQTEKDSFYYSTGGGVWVPVGEKTPAGTGTCVWPVPQTSAFQVLFKVVTLRGTERYEDVSDGFFSILPGSVDATPTEIVGPTGVIDSSIPVTPVVKVKNLGLTDASGVRVFFRIDSAAGSAVCADWRRVYADSLTKGIAGGAESTFAFKPWLKPHPPACYFVTCSTHVAGDVQPANNKKTGWFMSSSETGWWARKAMPEQPTTEKSPKDGAWLVAHPGESGEPPVVFAAKGNKTRDFYQFSPVANSWLDRAPLPDSEDGRVKLPSKGCVGVSDGERYIYMTKGNNTRGFWRYDVPGNKWDKRAPVPFGDDGKKVKGGNDLVYVPGNGDTGFVYLLKGYKTSFYSYNTRTDEWNSTLQSVPGGGGKEKYDKGSFLVYDDEHNCLYAHQAKYNDGTNHYMFKYDLGTKQWQTVPLKGMPLAGLHNGSTRNKKSKDGGSGAWYDRQLYALKGGNTQQFYSYTPGTNSWMELETIPGNHTAGTKKYVKAGGDFTSYGAGVFFALKGNKTYELWRYVVATSYASPPTPQVGGAQAQARAQALRMAIAPNPLTTGFATVQYSLPSPGPVAVTVFDVAGRSVLRTWSLARSATGTLLLDLQELAGGVYVVRLDADGQKQTQKLVVQR